MRTYPTFPFDNVGLEALMSGVNIRKSRSSAHSRGSSRRVKGGEVSRRRRVSGGETSPSRRIGGGGVVRRVGGGEASRRVSGGEGGWSGWYSDGYSRIGGGER
jgi:hypothetical protein